MRYGEVAAVAVEMALNYGAQVGGNVTLWVENETTVTRDEYGSIVSRSAAAPTEKNLYAFPVDSGPTAKTLESVGIREKCNILFYFSMLSWKRSGLNDISADLIRDTLRFNGDEIKIVDKKNVSAYRSSQMTKPLNETGETAVVWPKESIDYLYYVIGGMRN